MPSSQIKLKTTGVLLGGALVLAFSGAALRADEAPSTPIASEHSLNAETLPLSPDFDATPIAESTHVADLPAPTSDASTRVLFQQRKTAQISAANQARAWKLVERGTRAITSGNFSSAYNLYAQAAKANPTNPYALSGAADSALALGRNTEAEGFFRRALALSPGNLKLQKGLANSLVPQQKYQEASTLLKKVVAGAPRDFASAYQLAQIATWTNRYSEADNYYRRALALQPKNAEVWTAWGESLSFNKNPRAKDAFMGALKFSPNSTRAQVGLANLYLWNAEYSEAQKLYSRVLAREPRNLSALIGAGDALAFSNRQAEAVPYYRRALKLASANSAAQLGLGRALIQSKQEKEGVIYVQRVLARAPRNPEALQLLADAQAANSSSEGQALATYQRLLDTQTSSEDKADTWLRIAQIHERAGSWNKAEAAYSKAMALAPRDSEISLAYAQALIGENQWESAREVVDAAIRREPSNVRALTLQVVTESKIGSPERAATLANRLLALNLSTPADALVLAQALQTSGNSAGARQVLQRLATQNANDPLVALQVATAIRDAGMYDLARPLFEKLLVSQPKNAEARLNIAELLLWQNQYDAAQAQTKILLQNEPNNIAAQVLAATIALRRDEVGGLAGAESAAEAVLANDSRNVDALVLKTQVLSLRQQYAGAVTAAQAAVDAEPSNLEARLALARNLYYARQTPAAIVQYRELIKRAPADVNVKLELAKIYLDQNQLADAEQIYRDVLVASNALLPPVARDMDAIHRSYARVSPSLKPMRGERFYSARQSTPAVRFVSATTTSGTPTIPLPIQNTETAPIEDLPPSVSTPAAPDTTIAPPTEPATTNAPLPVLAIPESELPEADLDVTATVNATPIAPSLEEQIDANIGLGEVRRRQSRFDEAVEYFNAALAQDSSNVEARIGLAQSLRGKSEYLRALAETDRVLATDDKNLNARVLRAQLLADTGQSALAETELDALVEGLPENPTVETYLDLSSAFVELKNYDAAIQLLNLAAEDYPNRVEVQTRLAETYSFARRWDESLAVWNKLIALDARDAGALLGRARVYNFSTRLPQAEESYRGVLELEPNNYSALAELADILARQSEYPDSIRLYRQAIAANSGDLKTRVELARVLRYNRQFAEAETVLDNVLEVDARYAPAYTERSLARSGLGNSETAIADARRALEITPRDINAQLGLAEVLSYVQQYDESIRLYEAALKTDPTNTKARVDLGAALSYSGQYKDALAQLDAVLKENPTNLDAQIIRADTLGRSRRTDEAITAYQTILRTDTDNRRARVGLAESYAYARQYDKSIATYDQLIAAEPENISYRIAKGRTLGYARRYPQALSTLRSVVAANPTNVNARLALAEALTNSSNVVYRREAIAQYQTILKQDSQNTDARIGLGRVYSYSGQYKSAERELSEVLRRYPDNRDARYALAESQRFAGNAFDSRQNYERVLTRDPNNESAKIGLASVRRAISPSITAAYSSYSDSNNVRIGAYSLGAQVPTRAGTIGLLTERGKFEDEGTVLRRRSLSLILARRLGPIQARLLLSRVGYTGAPSRTLYDLGLQRSFGARKRIYITIAKREIIESLEAVQSGITSRVYQIGGEYPIGKHFDAELDITRYQFSDNNTRTTIAPSLYYRFRPSNPTLRIGLGYRHDNSRFTGRPYYTPQDYTSLAVLADYTKDEGRLRYGISASHPLTNSTGGGGGAGGNRPADTLFGNVTYEVNDLIDLFLNGGVVRSPNFDSNQFTAGATVRF